MLNKKIILSLLMGGLISPLSYADENDVPPVSVEISPTSSKEVDGLEHNQQVANLRKQENQVKQQEAQSKGASFIPNAPAKDDPDYWKQKNTNNSTAEDAQNNFETIDNEKVTQQKQALKELSDTLDKQKNEFKHVAFANKEKNDELNNTQEKKGPKTLAALAGTVWYATLKGGADSYVPGPVLVQLQEGPFAGGYALGEFQVAPDEEHVILIFHTLSDGKRSFPILAVAIDSKSQISGITGEIDHHYMHRFIVPAAIGFIQGAINLLKTNQNVVMNGQTTTVAGPSLNKTELGLVMASSAADKLQDAAIPQGVLKQPQIKIAPGTDIGFLLLKSI